jgi:hypothetical protein
MIHPSSLDLEAFACGERLAHVPGHLTACTECRTFVARLSALVGGEARESRDEKVVTHAPPARRAATRLSFIAPLATFAVAAAVLLIARRPSSIVTPVPESDPAPAVTAIIPPDPETTFKGGIQIAVIRERDGAQQRYSDVVTVRPGDRVRLEVGLDREQPLVGGILGDDGSWLELMPSAVRSAGTHLSERSARIDPEPLAGRILVGTPEAIERARGRRDAGALATLRIEWEVRR